MRSRTSACETTTGTARVSTEAHESLAGTPIDLLVAIARDYRSTFLAETKGIRVLVPRVLGVLLVDVISILLI